VPLPAQALDHGTGYLLAAAICRGLTGRLLGQGTATARASLIGTANLLMGARTAGTTADPGLAASRRVVRDTEWGPASAVQPPGTIAGAGGWWDVPAGPLGRHPAQFPGPGAALDARIDQGADLRG
jgi:hypothetical protein